MKILLMPDNHKSTILSRKANSLKNTNGTAAVHLIQTLYVITEFLNNLLSNVLFPSSSQQRQRSREVRSLPKVTELAGPSQAGFHTALCHLIPESLVFPTFNLSDEISAGARLEKMQPGLQSSASSVSWDEARNDLQEVFFK